MNVGGVVGYNDQGVGNNKNCYAAGIVSGSGVQAKGGLSGDKASSPGVDQNSVALNPAINGSTIGRICGRTGGSNNYARDDMLVNGAAITTGTGAGTIHGINVAVNNTVSLYTLFATNALFDPAVWDIPAGNLFVGGPLPTLRDMPGPVQNPTLP